MSRRRPPQRGNVPPFFPFPSFRVPLPASDRIFIGRLGIRALLSAAFCLAIAWTPVRAAAALLPLRHVALELPSAPAEILPADLDGDGRKDLVIVMARTEWGEIGNDRIEGMVQISEVVPALFDRREAIAFLARPDGSYARLGAPMELPDSVLSIEPGPAGVPLVALTDEGAASIRMAAEPSGTDEDGQPRPGLRLDPLIADPPVLAHSRTLLSRLDLVSDLDGDGTEDLLLPARDGLAIYGGETGGFASRPRQRLPMPGDWRRSGPDAQRFYPMPRIEDMDGDGIPDLLVADPTRTTAANHITVSSVLRGTKGRGFQPPLEIAFDPPKPAPIAGERTQDSQVEVAYFGDIDGDGRAELVTRAQLDTGKSELKQAKEPHHLYRFYHLTSSLAVPDAPYLQTEIVGHGIDADLGDMRMKTFQDLDGDGRKDLVTISLDFSLFQIVRAIATKRIGIGLDFHVYHQERDGSFHLVDGLDLSETLRVDLNDLKLERLAQFAGDFDGDGRIDFVHLGKGTSVTIHRGQPGGRYPEKPDLSIALDEEPQDVMLVRVVDLDGDGRSDLGITRTLPAGEAGASAPVRLELRLSGEAR